MPQDESLHIRGFRDMSPGKLMELNNEMQLSFLNETEVVTLRDHFRRKGRDPTNVELEVIAQNWCEHSYHGTYNGRVTVVDHSGGKPITRTYENLLKETIMAATKAVSNDSVVAAFADDAGILYFTRHNGKDYGFSGKVETHNHPSKISPFGGSATGSGGVLRDDKFCDHKGIIVVYCLPPPDIERDLIPEGVKDPLVYLEEIVAGNQDYGNDMGVPTVNSGLEFSKKNLARPTVYCGVFGLVDLEQFKYTSQPGDMVISIGGKTGRDGIHGAVGSSIGHDEKSLVKQSTEVQIGNPIEEQHWTAIMHEYVLPTGKITYTQDCGGGGYSSALGELPDRAGPNGGIEVYLDKVTLKEDDMEDWELMLSESQERQIATVRPDDLDEIMGTFDRYGVEASVIGRLTGDSRLRIYGKDADKPLVADIDMEFLRKGKPKVVRGGVYKIPDLPEPEIDAPDLTRAVVEVLSDWTVASKEDAAIRRFDHEVQGGTVIKPLMGADIHHLSPNDAAVIRPIPDCSAGFVTSYGINLKWGLKDMRAMVRGVMDQAIRKNIAHGGNIKHMGIHDNWCMANIKGDDEEIGRLAVGSQEWHDTAILYDVPGIAGKDSMNNNHRDTRTGEVHYISPTLLVTCQSVIPDIRTAVSSYAKRPGNSVYMLGLTRPELGGSVFYDLRDSVGNVVPDLSDEELASLRSCYEELGKVITTGIMPKDKIVRAGKAVNDGGLAVAAAQMAFGGNHGMELYLDRVPAEGTRHDYEMLLSESLGRVLLEVPEDRKAEFEDRMGEYRPACIGYITDDGVFRVYGLGGKTVISEPIETFNQAWKMPFRGL